MSVRRVLLVGCLGLGVATATFGGSRPVAVSPGSPSGELIGDACPTFNWGEVEGAKFYELVVYRIGAESGEPQPVWRQELPGSASGWTPSLERCLERGGRYAWSVRALGEETVPEWSAPAVFRVAAGPSKAEFQEAVGVVRQHLALAERDGAVCSTQVRTEISSKASASGTAHSADSHAAFGPPPPTVMSVDGNIDAASFTGDGSRLTGVFTGESTVFIPRYGSAQDACDALRQAAASVSPRPAKRIVLDTGTYDCGSNPVELFSGIALVGAGEVHTEIVGSVDSADGLLRIAHTNTVRDLLVKNNVPATAAYSVAIGDKGTLTSHDTVIQDVTAEAIGGAKAYGIRLDNTSTVTCSFDPTVKCPRRLINVIASASGGTTWNRGILLAGSSYATTLVNVTAEGADGTESNGMYLSGTIAQARNSIFVASTHTIREVTSDVTVANSQLAGGTVSGTQYTCFGAYDENFVALSANCGCCP